jgi:hypothetical protein
MNLTKADEIIFNTIKINPSEDDIFLFVKYINTIENWDYFSETIIKNGIAPIYYANFMKGSNIKLIPKQHFLEFKEAYYKTLSKNIILYDSFKQLIQVFTDNNISVIVLKGMFLAEKLYKDIGLRQISDIDLLLKYNDIEKAGNLLMELGFENLNLKLKRDFYKNKHFIFLKKGVIIELHQHVFHYTEKFNIDINKYWSQAKPQLINGVNAFVLSDIDMVQQLCIHLYIHLREGKFSLISFYDIIFFIQSLNNNFKWSLLFENSKQDNCLKEISIILLIIDKFIGSFLTEDEFKIISKYSDDKFEKRFIDIFHGKNLKLVNAEVKINKFKESKGVTNKLKYYFNDVFQIKQFMINRYNPKFPKLYFIYYPIRMFSIVYKYLQFKYKRST